MLKTNNQKTKRLGDFLTRTPKKADFTEYIYEFVNGDKVVIPRSELSKEIDEALFKEHKKEVNNNRVQIEDHRAYSKNCITHEKLLDYQESDENLEELIIETFKSEALGIAIKSLEKIDQEILYKKYFEEKPNTLIAKELGISEGTVRYKLPKIIEKIKKNF